LGRSNVGKSSLLNCLISPSSSSSSSSSSATKTRARVGKTPGATASVNLYALSSSNNKSNNNNNKDLLAFADLPGFGYAKLSQARQASIQAAADHYLSRRGPALCLAILLVDIRRNVVSDDDVTILNALLDQGLPLLVVATKIDKLSSSEEAERCLLDIRQGLGLPRGQPLLAVSSVTGQGTRELWRIILEACESTVQELRRRYHNDNDKDEYSDDDDEEDEAIAFEDNDDDVVYSQGYDWIRDIDNDDGDYDEQDSNDYAYDDDIDDEEDYHYNGNEGSRNNENERNQQQEQRSAVAQKGGGSGAMKNQSIKSLKKQARDLERRKEV
jgi:GTP-binding protein